MEIPVYYDPMIAKLITYGADRSEAISRMLRAISEYDITGIQTTLNFGKFVMEHEAFTSGNFNTHFVGKYFNPENKENTDEDEALMAAIVALRNLKKKNNAVVIETTAGTSGNWLKNRKKY